MANLKITDLTAESSITTTDVLAFVDLSVAATRKATIADIVVGGGGITATSTSTLTNKTLTAPIISTISNTGTLTLPTITDTIVGRATTDTLTNKTLTSPTINTANFNNTDIQNIRLAEFNGIVDNGNSSTADTIDWGTGNYQKSTLTGNCTYTFTAPSGPARVTMLVYTGAGSFAVTWPAAVKWTGGTAPTITTTASKVDIVTFLYDGTNFWGTYTQNYTA